MQLFKNVENALINLKNRKKHANPK